MAIIVRPRSGRSKVVHAVEAESATWNGESYGVQTLCGRSLIGDVEGTDVSEVSCKVCESALARVYVGPTVDLESLDGNMAAAAGGMREALKPQTTDSELRDETEKAITLMRSLSRPAAPVLTPPETVQEPRQRPVRTAGQMRHGMVKYQRAARRHAMKEAARNGK